MEKVRQQAVVASIEISEPGERLRLPLVGDDAGLLVTSGLDIGFAARLAVGDAAAVWLAGADIEP